MEETISQEVEGVLSWNLVGVVMLTCCNIKELSAFVFRNTMLLFLKHFKRHCMTEVEFHFQCSVAFILKTAGREGSVQENDGRSSRIAESLYPVAMVNTVEL